MNSYYELANLRHFSTEEFLLWPMIAWPRNARHLQWTPSTRLQREDPPRSTKRNSTSRLYRRESPPSSLVTVFTTLQTVHRLFRKHREYNQTNSAIKRFACERTINAAGQDKLDRMRVFRLVKADRLHDPVGDPPDRRWACEHNDGVLWLCSVPGPSSARLGCMVLHMRST